MSTLKLSQIAPALSPPALTDQIVGVTAGTTDNLYTVSQVAIGGGAFGGGRTKQLADGVYYVATTGSDSNNGLTPLTAFATLQHADDVISGTLDLNGFGVTVNIAAGTYVGVANISGYYSSQSSNKLHSTTGLIVNFIGDVVTPTNVVVTFTVSPDGRHVGYQRGESVLHEVDSGWDGIDFNIYNAGGGFGPVIVSDLSRDATTIGVLGGNWQIDCGTTGLPLFAGNIVMAGTGTLNGSTVGWANSTTSNIYATSSQGFIGQVNCFVQGTMTVTNNPHIDSLFSVFSTSQLQQSFNAGLTGAYVGKSFNVDSHSTFNSVGNDWNTGAPVFGTGTKIPTLSTGGIYSNNFFGRTFEATGGQIFGSNKNYSNPVTGFNLALGLADSIVILDPAGTLAAGTVTMMAAMDQMRVNIRTTQTITSFTLAPGSGQSIGAGTPTTLTAGQIVDVIFQASNNTWYPAV